MDDQESDELGKSSINVALVNTRGVRKYTYCPTLLIDVTGI